MRFKFPDDNKRVHGMKRSLASSVSLCLCGFHEFGRKK